MRPSFFGRTAAVIGSYRAGAVVGEDHRPEQGLRLRPHARRKKIRFFQENVTNRFDKPGFNAILIGVFRDKSGP